MSNDDRPRHRCRALQVSRSPPPCVDAGVAGRRARAVRRRRCVVAAALRAAAPAHHPALVEPAGTADPAALRPVGGPRGRRRVPRAVRRAPRDRGADRGRGHADRPRRLRQLGAGDHDGRVVRRVDRRRRDGLQPHPGAAAVARASRGSPASWCTPRPTGTRRRTAAGTCSSSARATPGAEIAVDLTEGGASRVRLAIRTAPHIVRRSNLGWPAQGTGILVRHLPVPVVDRIAAGVARVEVPDLSSYGLPRPTTGLYSRVKQGSVPLQDVGLIAAVQARTVEPVAAVESFDDGAVVLADGSRITPEVDHRRHRVPPRAGAVGRRPRRARRPRPADRARTAHVARRPPGSTSPATPTRSAACSASWRSTPSGSRGRSASASGCPATRARRRWTTAPRSPAAAGRAGGSRARGRTRARTRRCA